MKTVPHFKNEPERQQWFIENASFFTLIRRINMRNERLEFPTKGEAEHAVRRLIEREPEARYMMYAVVNELDNFVRAFNKKNLP